MWHSDVYVALLTVIAWTREATQGEIITTGESLTVPLSPSILLFLSLHFYDLFTLSVYLFTPSISSLFLSLYSHRLSVSIYLSLYISSLNLPPFSLSLYLFRLSVSSLCLPQFSISSLFLPCLGLQNVFKSRNIGILRLLISVLGMTLVIPYDWSYLMQFILTFYHFIYIFIFIYFFVLS